MARSRNAAQVGPFSSGQDFGVREPGVVVDDGVDVVVTGAGGAVVQSGPMVRRGSSLRTPAASVGNAAQPLHGHMPQLAGTFPLVTDGGGLRRADPLSGHRVQVG